MKRLKLSIVAALAGGGLLLWTSTGSNAPHAAGKGSGPLGAPPEAFVDALIGGNGDGAYGALGSGAGGTSVRSVMAPAAVDLVLELQNEGGRADAYTVTWSSIPGWVATVAGTTSPFVSDNIPPPNSRFYTFHVEVPEGTTPGEYIFVLDVVSGRDPAIVESVEARFVVVEGSRADLVIDGDGLGLFGPSGSGLGGASARDAMPGSVYTASLEVWNAGITADSMLVSWTPPSTWPAGSVSLSDGTTSFASAFWTPVITPGASLQYAVVIQVPLAADAGPQVTIIDAQSFLAPLATESVRHETRTAAVVRGVVFDDVDHDGAHSVGEPGLPGVTVANALTGVTAITAANGSYAMQVAAGTAIRIVEVNPSGFLSTSPDTVSSVAIGVGDTLEVNFGDVGPVRLSAGVIRAGRAGGYVDFPHTVEVATAGAVALTVTSNSAGLSEFLVDENGNGIFDSTDRPLVPGDLELDPVAGKRILAILLRVFLPPDTPLGATTTFRLEAEQRIAGTPLVSTASATDAVVVSAGGVLALQKSVDTAEAVPGDVLTYTITFVNAGTDSVQNVVILDPISAHVEPLPDAFGPGRDVEWTRAGGTTLYLTMDFSDADECEYRPTDRSIRLSFSKNSPYFLQPGEQGTLRYRVVVR